MISTEINTSKTNNDDVEEFFFSENLESPEQLALAARIDMYAMLADMYRYPDVLTRVFVSSGEFKFHVLRILENLPYEVSLSAEELELLTYPDGVLDDDVEAEYIRLFEAGPGNPPCPLVEGIHMDKEDGRRTIFKDLILFYNHFGLSYAEGNGEDQPDHITYELEFLHYLAFLELRALQKNMSPAPLQQAQFDFLTRHPAKWTEQLSQRMKDIEDDLREGVNRGVVRFYRNVTALTHRCVTLDLNYLSRKIES